MNSKYNQLLIFSLSLILLVSLQNVRSLGINQSEPSFISTPNDRVIGTDFSFTLEWQVRADIPTTYSIFMERNVSSSVVVSSGDITDDPVKLTLDSLPEGEYIFAFQLIYSGGSKFSNITIQVEASSSSETSTADGLPGLTLPSTIIALFTTLIIIQRKRIRK